MRSARFVLPLALACGARTVMAQAATSRLVAELGDSSDVPRRNAAYTTLLQTKPAAAVPLLVRSLPGFDLSAQSLGITVLRSYPRETAVPALLRLARGDPPSLALCAAVALQRLGEPGQGPVITAALASPDLTEAEQGQIIGWLHGIDIPAVGVAVRELLTPRADLGVFDAALYHLARSGDAASCPRIEQLIAEVPEDSEQAALCAAFLAVLGSQEHGQQLASFLTEDRRALFFRLQRYLALARGLDETTIEALATLCETASDLSMLRAAASVLGRHGGQRAVQALLILLEHPDSTVVVAALQALARLGGSLETDALRKLLDSEHPKVVLKAADLLRRRDDPAGLERVLEIASQDPTQRREAMRVLTGFHTRAVVEPLIEALIDPDRVVRERAKTGLTRVLQRLLPYRRVDLESSGYSVDAPEAARVAAAERVLAWWRQVDA